MKLLKLKNYMSLAEETKCPFNKENKCIECELWIAINRKEGFCSFRISALTKMKKTLEDEGWP